MFVGCCSRIRRQMSLLRKCIPLTRHSMISCCINKWMSSPLSHLEQNYGNNLYNLYIYYSYTQLLNCGIGKDSWESLGLQGDPTSPSSRRSVLGVHWKDWCWSWNSNTLATSCKELTHWKRPGCWEGLGAGGEGDNRIWDGWMPSPTRWTWVWVNYRSWWWTGRPVALWFMGSQRIGHDWATEPNWTDS